MSDDPGASFSPGAVGDPALCHAEDTDETRAPERSSRRAGCTVRPARACRYCLHVQQRNPAHGYGAANQSGASLGAGLVSHLDAPSNNEQSAYHPHYGGDSADAETRRFYSKVTDRTRQLAAKL